MTETILRRAIPTDAATLAALGRETFVETFGHLYPVSDLQPYLAEVYAPANFDRFLRDATQALWVIEREGEAIGYAQAGTCALPHPDVTPHCGELKRLYVHSKAQGGGLGNTLLKAALTWLTKPGRDLWIGVWSQNFGAQRLYTRHGFEKAGEYEFPVGKTRDREFILRRGG
jgi:ribosomal protein S18 acetylase RimI-like enzyme